MTGNEFTEQCWNCKIIRQHIINQAKRRSARKELQEEFIQEAWLIISALPNCYGIDSCKEISQDAIYRAYKHEYNHSRLIKKSHYRDKNSCFHWPDNECCGDKYIIKLQRGIDY
ncbi:MAG: hypothetical protein WC455_13750 [Dehalococcoidia bacterium]|jgi:hypothetical protein